MGSLQRGPDHLRDELAALFSEINALAIQLKQTWAEPDQEKPLPPGGHSVLRILERSGPGTVPYLARQRSTSRQNIQIVVNRLVAQGLVEFASNEAHKRSPLVVLTTIGKGALAKANEQQERVLERLLPQLSETDLRSATRVLKDLRQMLTKNAGSAGPVRSKAGRVHPLPPSYPQRSTAAKPPAQVATPSEPSTEAGQDENELPFNLL